MGEDASERRGRGVDADEATGEEGLLGVRELLDPTDEVTVREHAGGVKGKMMDGHAALVVGTARAESQLDTKFRVLVEEFIEGTHPEEEDKIHAP